MLQNTSKTNRYRVIVTIHPSNLLHK